MNKKIILAISVCTLLVLSISMLISRLIVKNSIIKMNSVMSKEDKIYDYGLTFYSNKEYDKAKRAFNIVVDEKADSPKKEIALLKLAEIYKAQNDLLKTREIYKKVIENFSDSETLSKVNDEIGDINIKILFSPQITEDSFQYEIKPNDTLGKIAKEHNTTIELLRKSNDIKKDIIIPGRFLKVTKSKFNILVDKSENLLFLKDGDEIIKTYKVSTGINNSTPVGKFKIEEKLTSPLWYKVGAVVEPNSPDYELGKYWMGISIQGYGIHGTKDPQSIGKQITKGCVRMLNEDVEELYTIVPSGTEVVIVD